MNKLSAPLAKTRKFRRKSGQEFRGESDRTESREITQTQNRCEEARRQAHRRAPACRQPRLFEKTSLPVRTRRIFGSSARDCIARRPPQKNTNGGEPGRHRRILPTAQASGLRVDCRRPACSQVGTRSAGCWPASPSCACGPSTRTLASRF